MLLTWGSWTNTLFTLFFSLNNFKRIIFSYLPATTQHQRAGLKPRVWIFRTIPSKTTDMKIHSILHLTMKQMTANFLKKTNPVLWMHLVVL